MGAITFEAVVHDNVVEIPREYCEKIVSPVFVTIHEGAYPGRRSPPRISPRRGKRPLTIDDFSAPFIDTTSWKFDRDEANER
jgi:hypothetical protein